METDVFEETRFRLQEESDRFKVPASMANDDDGDASHPSKRLRTENGGADAPPATARRCQNSALLPPAGIAAPSAVDDEADASMTWRANHEVRPACLARTTRAPGTHTQ